MEEEFSCEHEGCGKSFKKESDLRRHKATTNSHNYCKKCDLLFHDWDDLVRHKAQQADHLSCKFCGRDFKSIGGLKRHITGEHPPKQDVKCLGCGLSFPRAALMIAHLEQGDCSVITAQQFAGSLQQKHIVNKLLRDPEALTSVLETISYNQAAEDDDEGGGVSLNNPIDDQDEDTGVALQEHASMVPEKESHADQPRLGERWPSLPQSKSQPVGAAPPVTEFSKLKVSGDVRLPSKAADMHPKAANSVWNKTGNASAVLFPNAKATRPKDWKAKVNAREEEIKLSHGMNILSTRFWDPSSEDYNPDNFWHPVYEAYCCPFRPCDQRFPVPMDLEIHITRNHRITQMRCPTCLKLFPSATALVQHCEAPLSKCKIARSDKFGQALDIISGGFLEVREDARSDMREMPEVDYGPNHPEDGVGLTHSQGDQRVVTRLPDKVTFEKIRDKRTLKVTRIMETHKFKGNIYSSTKSPYWEHVRSHTNRVLDQRGDPGDDIVLADGQVAPRAGEKTCQEFYIKEGKPKSGTSENYEARED